MFKSESILVKNSLDKKENKMRENFYIALIKNTVKEIKHKIQTLFHHLSAYISAIHLDSSYVYLLRNNQVQAKQVAIHSDNLLCINENICEY